MIESIKLLTPLGAKKLLEEQKPVIIFEFCDWAEENSGRFEIGESQKILKEAGYDIYLASSDGMVQLGEVIKDGYANLIALPSDICTQTKRNK